MTLPQCCTCMHCGGFVLESLMCASRDCGFQRVGPMGTFVSLGLLASAEVGVISTITICTLLVHGFLHA